MEFDVLKLLEFRIEGETNLLDTITSSLSKISAFSNLPEDLRHQINDTSLYISFLLSIDSSIPYLFSDAEVASASIYMAVK